MKKIKLKKIPRRLLTAAVVLIGLTYLSTPAKTDYNNRDFTANNPGNFDRGNFYEKYKLGDSPRLHVSIEHYKERNGFTPVLISTGSLTLRKCMDRNGSVFDYIDIGNRYKEPLFTINVDEGFILVCREAIPCEITLQEKMRTRLRLSGENANAAVAVSKDKKEGELFLFNGRIKAARLCFVKDETENIESEVEILGPDIHGMGKFIFERETKILYSLEEYKQLKEKKERAQKALSASSINSGKSIPITERQALTALYNSTNGDSWDNNSGWKTPPLEADGFAAYGSEGTWYGITVESDQVTQIYLGWNNLTGTIPPDLENLINLKSLYLCDNLISGSIPPELGNLSNLHSLDLSYNCLSGSIPGELGNLGTLSSLVLNINYLSGSIPPELGNLENLENLSLYANYLSGSIPAELGNLLNLRGLDFWDNSLSGSIPPELGNLNSIEGIGFGRNNLSGSIPPELGNLNNLKTLYISYNSLSGNIPPELGNLSNLFGLYLKDNSLSGSIPFEIGNLRYLENLDLENNNFSGSIPPELGYLSDLCRFRLDRNMFSGEIPITLMNLTKLSNWYTDIGYNALYTNESTLINFLNEKDPDWADTQTIASTDVTAALINPTSIRISWAPIRYTDDPGGYEVHMGTTCGGPYTLYSTTADKTVSSMTVTGLVPGTTYYFVVRTVTYPHTYNKNTVTSEFSSESIVTLPSITITSPNGGEYWTLNTTHDITWTSTGLTDNVHIILVQNGKKVALIAKNIDPSPGFYSWTVGECLRGTVTPGTNYKILIIERGTKVQDRSDTSFSISAPFLTITTPNGGENWTINASREITWLASGLSNNIDIILEQNGIKVALIAKSINFKQGSYPWKVGECLRGSVSAGTNNKILIKEKNSTVKDRSDNSFSISEPSITVTSPNGGESWVLNATHNITWHAAGITGNLKISLWKDGIKIGVIANNINPETGSIPWTAGQYSGGTAAPGTGYTIKIKEKGSPVSDSSDAVFSLTD